MAKGIPESGTIFKIQLCSRKEIYGYVKYASGGYFLYYEILRKGNSQISYPMPWVTNLNQSFLMAANELDKYLVDLGLSNCQITNQTQLGIEFFAKLFSKVEKFGLPKLGLNVLMGEITKVKHLNLFTHLKNDQLELKSGVVKK